MAKFILSLIFLANVAVAANFSADNFLAYTSSQLFDPASRTKKITMQAPTLAASWALTLPTTDGNNLQFLQTDGNGVTTWASEADPNAWLLTGNSGTTAGTNFVGTTDAKDLVFKTNATENMRLKASNGFLGVNETSPQAPVHASTSGGADGVLTLQNTSSASHGRYDFGIDSSGFFHLAQNGAGFWAFTVGASGENIGIGQYGGIAGSVLGVYASDLDSIPMIAKGNSGATADLQQWRLSDDTIEAKVDHAGKFTVANILDNGLTVSQLVATDGSKNLVSQATGALSDAGTDGIVVTNGAGSVVGSGTSLAQHVADTTHNGYLSSTDWNTFNGKQSTALTSAHLFVGNVSNVATDVAASGDVSLANTGAFTVSKVNGVAYGTSPSTNTVPVVTSSNTITYETVPVAAGGTNQTSYTNGQLLIGNTSGNTLTKATLTQGSGITITNGNGSITIAASGSAGNFGAGVLSVAFQNFSSTVGYTTTSSTETDFTEVGSPTITTLYSSGFTSVGKTSGKAGVDFTAPNTGTVEACAFVESTNSSGTGAIHLALADGSNNNLMLAPAWATGSNQELGRTLCGYLDVTATTGYTVKMRGWTNSGGTLRIGDLDNNLDYGLWFTIKYVK